MGSEKITVTRKIQLIIDTKDKEEIIKAWKTLYGWRYICYRAANLIATHTHLQYQLKDLFYLHEGAKVKLTNYSKDGEGILNTSFLNTTYQVLSKNFKGEIPTAILGSLNNSVRALIGKEQLAIARGERSVRNYRAKIPIPIPVKSIVDLHFIPEGKYYTFSIHGINFKTYFGRNNNSTRTMWNRYLTGEYKLCTSNLIIDSKKIFLLTVFQFDQESVLLDAEKVAEVSLSIEIPMILKVGNYRYEIGSKEEYLHRRIAIQNALRRCQKGATSSRSQHGRKRKTKAIDKYKEKEKNYINYRVHNYSRRLIDLCVKHNVATIILINQDEKEEVAKGDNFLLRNWGYFSLREKIEYKARMVGIKIVIE